MKLALALIVGLVHAVSAQYFPEGGQSCDSGCGWCSTDKSINKFEFQLSGLGTHDEALYNELGTKGNSSYTVNACGTLKSAHSEDGKTGTCGKDSTAACYCTPEFGGRCGSIGEASTRTWTVKDTATVVQTFVAPGCDNSAQEPDPWSPNDNGQNWTLHQIFHCTNSSALSPTKPYMLSNNVHEQYPALCPKEQDDFCTRCVLWTVLDEFCGLGSPNATVTSPTPVPGTDVTGNPHVHFGVAALIVLGVGTVLYVGLVVLRCATGRRGAAAFPGAEPVMRRFRGQQFQQLDSI